MNSTTNQSSSNVDPVYAWITYIGIWLLGFGTLTNLINISVFANPKLTDLSYKYMLAKSIANFLYLAFTFANQLMNYCTVCPWSTSYSAAVYNMTIGFYVLSCICIFRVLVENLLSIYTYSIITHRIWFTRSTFKWSILISLVLAALIYASKPFNFYIGSTKEPTTYYVGFNNFALSKANRIITYVQSLIRLILSVVSLTALNLLNVVEFTQRYQRRHSSLGVLVLRHRATKNDELRSMRNIIKMVLISTFLKVFLEAPVCISLILLLYSTDFTRMFYLSADLFFLSSSFDFLVYYLFNKHYRNVLLAYLRLD